MSFSNEVKSEVCETYKMSEGCKAALLYGFLFDAKKYSESEIELILECKEVAEYILSQISKLYRINIGEECLFKIDGIRKTLHQIHIKDKIVCKNIYDSFNCGKFAEHISLLSLDESITWAFIKGIFLACGSVSDPESEYHLEFIFKNKSNALTAENMLSSLSLKPKTMLRRGSYVVYFKDSSAIEDILTGIGAVKMVLGFMDLKVIKDLRNRINRQNNCETANLKRTIDVATAQVEAIELIFAKRGIESLSDDMKKIALFRLENPEISLNEMTKLLNGEFSKSGIDRRLKKLVQMAEEIKETLGK